MKPEERIARLLAALAEANDIIDPPGAIGAIPMEEGEVLKLSCVDKLSKTLMHETEKLHKLKAKGKNSPVLVHKAMSPVAINTLAVEMLEACVINKKIPPQSLNDLIRLQLGADLDVPKEKSLKRLMREAHMSEKYKMEPNIGPTELGRLFNINKSTASRWLQKQKAVQSRPARSPSGK